MEMEWNLARVREGWKVRKGRTLSSTYLEPKDFGARSHGEASP